MSVLLHWISSWGWIPFIQFSCITDNLDCCHDVETQNKSLILDAWKPSIFFCWIYLCIFYSCCVSDNINFHHIPLYLMHKDNYRSWLGVKTWQPLLMIHCSMNHQGQTTCHMVSRYHITWSKADTNFEPLSALIGTHTNCIIVSSCSVILWSHDKQHCFIVIYIYIYI